MLNELLGDWYDKVLRVVEFECKRVLFADDIVGHWYFGVDDWRHDYGLRVAPEYVLAEHKVAERQRQATCLLYRHATGNVTGARVILHFRRRRVVGRLRGGLAYAILRKRAGYSTNFHLQSTRDFALLTDYRRWIVQLDVVEENVQEYVCDANQVVIFLRFVEWILSLSWYFVLIFEK